MFVSASGPVLSRLPRPRPALGLCRRERPRPAASTNLFGMDHPASVSHQVKRSGPLMHVLHAWMQALAGARLAGESSDVFNLFRWFMLCTQLLCGQAASVMAAAIDILHL
eukprot:158138-Chlamydomonas_euryale.AAC.1